MGCYLFQHLFRILTYIFNKLMNCQVLKESFVHDFFIFNSIEPHSDIRKYEKFPHERIRNVVISQKSLGLKVRKVGGKVSNLNTTDILQ